MRRPQRHSRPNRGITAIAAALLVCTVAFAGAPRPARAQEPGGPSITVNQVDAGGYPAVSAIVTVLDGRGVPVGGLTAADFQASDGTGVVPVSAAVAAQDATLPLSVVLALDVSGSMEPALPAAKQAAAAFVEQLGPNDRAALVTFSAAVTPVVDFTADKQALGAAIAGLTASGDTALYEAVQTSAFIASLSQTPRTAVVLLSDGKNDTDTSTATAESAFATADGARVPIFTIAFGDTADEAFLRGLADRTRGQYHAAAAADVGEVYQGLAGLLRSQYALSLQPEAAADGAEASLTITAIVAGVPATASAPFTRGTAPPPPPAPTIVALPTATAVAEPAAEGAGRTIAAIAVGAAVALAVLALAVWGVARMAGRRRAARAAERVTAPNPARAAAQGVPAAAGAAPIEGAQVRARLVRPGAEGGIEFGAVPVTIGSDPASTVVLPPSPQVASHHARIWVRGEKIMLHHTGGALRPTVIDGRGVDWVVLEDGDQFLIGPHAFRAERLRAEAADAAREAARDAAVAAQANGATPAHRAAEPSAS